MDAIADLKVPRCGPGDGLRDYNSGPVATHGQGHHLPDFQPPLAPNNRTNAKHGVSFNVWSEPDAELENYDRVPDLLVPPVSKAARAREPVTPDGCMGILVSAPWTWSRARAPRPSDPR